MKNYRKLAAIMFTDMVGYTALMQQDEMLARQKRNRHREVLEEKHQLYHGEIIQYFGDGTLSIFTNSYDAVECAVEIQKALRGPIEVPLRIGIHSGNVVIEEDEIIGDAVNIASRIESFANAGGVFISDSVQDQIRNHTQWDFVALGKFNLKNVERPFEIYAISAEGLTIPEPNDVQLSRLQRNGLLYCCLMNEPVDLFHIADLAGSQEVVDELLQLPFIRTDQKTLWIDEEAISAIHNKFKWSEKVKAAEKLATYFHNKSIRAETMGDLWQMAGKKENACVAYLEAMTQYRKQQLIEASIRAGEKLVNLDALSSADEFMVLNNLIECYECLGQVHDIIEVRTKLLEKPQTQEDAEIRANILRSLAIDYGKQGSWVYYRKYREKAASLFRVLGKSEDAALEFLALTNRGIDEINIIAGLQWVNEALEDAHHTGKVELISKAKALKAYLMAMKGEIEPAHKLAEEALELALKNNLLESAAYAYRKLAGTYEYASDYVKAKEVFTQAAGFCQAQNIEAGVQLCFSCLSWVLFRMGEWKKAIEVSEALINDHEVNNPSKATAHCVIAYIEALRGRIRPAEKHTLDGMLLSQQEHFLLLYHILQLPMAKVFELKGDMDGAREWYEKIVDEWHITQERHDVLLTLMDASRFFLEKQNRGAIRKCLQIYSTICKVTGNKEALGSMAFALGINAVLNKQPKIAMEHFSDARKYLQSLNIPYQLMLVDFEIGKCFLMLQRPQKASDTFKDLLLRTKKFGLAPLTAKITGVINSITLAQNPGKNILTSRQMDVVTLLGKGLSNKEIASKLHLSTRTVDMHIRNLFDRLGCNTRWDAVEKARSLGLI